MFTKFLLFIFWISLILAALHWLTGYYKRKIEHLLPPKGQFIQVKHHRIHYREYGQGQGPYLLLIHGLTGNTGDLCYKLAPKLADNFHVIVMDRLGCGYSSQTSEIYADINFQADVAADFLTALNIKKAYIAGHSLGGAVSLNFAVHHPEMVEALLLISPVSMPTNQLPFPFTLLYFLRPDPIRRLASHFLVTPIAWSTRNLSIKSIFHPEPVPNNFSIEAEALLGTRAEALYAASCDILGCQTGITPEMVIRYKEITVPCSMLYGTADRILDYHKHGLALQYYIPQLEITLLANKGHMITASAYEQIASTAEQLKHRTETQNTLTTL